MPKKNSQDLRAVDVKSDVPVGRNKRKKLNSKYLSKLLIHALFNFRNHPKTAKDKFIRTEESH